MGLFDFFRRSQPQAKAQIVSADTTPKLTHVEKERIMVDRVKTEDMLQFSEMPYDLNCPVKKFTPDNGHPFAYIDLNSKNQFVAKEELKKISECIERSPALSSLIPKSIHIPIHDIIFQQCSPHYGYTRLMCTPHTMTGKVSKYPLSLSFMTRLEPDTDTTHGEAFYGKDGSISKGTVYCWRRGEGYFFDLRIMNGELSVFQIKTTASLNEKNLPSVIYSATEK